MRRTFWAVTALLAAQASAAEPHVPIKWPVPACAPQVVASASPAPATSNSDSLLKLPASASLIPMSAAVIVSLTPENRPVIECVIDEGYPTGFQIAAVEAISDMVFSTPRAVNEAGPGGRYLVRVSTLFGASWVHAPPKLPILPACANLESRGAVLSGFDVPKPVSRVQPQYPPGAEGEGIEGKVSVRLEVFSSGRVTPVCISEATPPGWFEAAAVEAVAAWRFPQPEGPGQRFFYEVRIRFELME